MNIKSIVIVGRRWMDSYGNTYFSAFGLVDGRILAEIKYEYGYGDQYAVEMFRALEDGGHIVPRLNPLVSTGRESFWQYSERNMLTVTCLVADVARKGDL